MTTKAVVFTTEAAAQIAGASKRESQKLQRPLPVRRRPRGGGSSTAIAGISQEDETTGDMRTNEAASGRDPRTPGTILVKRHPIDDAGGDLADDIEEWVWLGQEVPEAWHPVVGIQSGGQVICVSYWCGTVPEDPPPDP